MATMNTLIRDIINAARTTLLETTADGTRWTNAELVEYLNDAYRFVLEIEPEAFVETMPFECVAGVRQSIPDRAISVIDITRNIDGNQQSINNLDMSVIKAIRPNWMGESQTRSQEFFMIDDRDPRNFFVYPPAMAGSKIEMIAAVQPVKHVLNQYEDGATRLHLNDRYYPALLNYILHRSFDKDADDGGNMIRADSYLQKSYNAMGTKMQNAMRASPNFNGAV